MSKIMKTNVLVILSKINNTYTDFTDRLEMQIKSSSHKNLKFHCLTDPSKRDIELFLQENECMCIIPSSPFAVIGRDGGVFKAKKYNIPRLLRTLGVDFFGCDYITGLMLNDKAECLRLSGLNPSVRVVTRYNFNNDLLYETDSVNSASVMLSPYSSGNYIEMRKYTVCSNYEVRQAISELFITNSEIDEVLVQMGLNYKDSIIVTIIGNPPLSTDFICKSLENGEFEQLSDYKEDISELLAKSYELFHSYSLRDFCQFIYVRCQHNDKYYLTDINGFDALSESILISCMKRYGYNTIDVLTVLTIIFLCRQKLSHPVLELLGFLVKPLGSAPINRLLPLAAKTHIYGKYDYTDICYELEGRFLKPDESNKYEISRLLVKTLKQHPIHIPNLSSFLGNPDDHCTFLEKYEEIPISPKNQEEILNESTQILSGQMRWHSPLTLYNVNPPTMFNTVVASAIMNMYNPNSMAQDTSAGILEMERQISRQLSGLIGWNANESAGTFTPGGKVCISYAIKCGLNRCGLHSEEKPVVIFSEINHFSIESSCYMLGLPKSSLMSIPINSSGTIDFHLFKEALTYCFEKRIPIACIIFSGGNTTHCAVENVKMGREVISWAVEKYDSTYEPYLYFDIVVGWPWLFFKDYNFTENALNIEAKTLRKIMHVTDLLKYSGLADGAGIDFHKYGFAPFTNSMFLAKNASELYQVSGVSVKEMFREPYHYTFNNSRSATDIISAWNILQSVGVQGFQSYIANMVNAANVFADELPSYGFEILDKNSTYGFATIAWACNPADDMDFNAFIQRDNDIIDANGQYLYALTEYFRKHQKYALQVRFLPKHKIVSKGRDASVIIILPMTLNINREIATSVARIMGIMKREFDERCLAGLESYNGVIPEEVPK